MAERKQVNKYYPPDWDPRKGSANKRVGQHPLRDRAKKLSQGILVIRFELPYNIWCGGCGSHVGMGVRYNAEKSKVGNYYSTPIYKFRMKCHLCDNKFEIQTDPQNHDYVILSGARRKEQRWDPHENEQIVPEDKATQKKMATDAMYKLEHGSDDKTKASEKTLNLAQLEESRISMVDDYILNRMARDKFRSEKKVLKEAADADQAILDRACLDIELLEETEEDKKLAGLMKYTCTSSFEDKQKEKRKHIELRPIFKQPVKEVLPNQRHSVPALSRRGEIKQKLGWALKAASKNTFDSSEFKLKKESPKSLLGVRIKTSSAVTVSELSTSSNSIKPQISSSSVSQQYKICENNEVCLSHSTSQEKINHQKNTESNSFTTQSERSLNQSSENYIDTSFDKSSSKVNSERQSQNVLKEDQDTSCDSQNTSGLKSLMSSYVSSDSDSDT